MSSGLKWTMTEEAQKVKQQKYYGYKHNQDEDTSQKKSVNNNVFEAFNISSTAIISVPLLPHDWQSSDFCKISTFLVKWKGKKRND